MNNMQRQDIKHKYVATGIVIEGINSLTLHHNNLRVVLWHLKFHKNTHTYIVTREQSSHTIVYYRMIVDVC